MNDCCTRRSFLARAGLFGYALSLAGCIHGPRLTRVRRIGFLAGDEPTLNVRFDEGLRIRGWVEGDNLVVERRILRRGGPAAADHAAELASMDLELVVVAALPLAIEMRRANPAMPLVIATGAGLVSNGFAASLERPGGNATGMEELPPGVTAKRLSILKSVAPGMSRVGLLSTTPGRGGHEAQLADAEQAAAAHGVSVRPFRVHSQAELQPALDAMVAGGMQGFLNFQGGLSLANRQLIVDHAALHRLPAIYQSVLFVEAGGLLSWAPDQGEQFRTAAGYVDQILRGARAGDLPIRYPERYYLTINSTAARLQGIELPPAVLAQADRVLS